MRKIGLLFVVFAMVLSFGALGFASGDHSGGHKMVGEVVKIDGPMVTVKDEHGKSRKFHVNGSTNLTGKVKAGVKVKVESTDKGHAISMEVLK